MENEAYSKAEVRAAEAGFPDRGPICDHCKTRIPQFSDLSEQDEMRVRQLIRDGRPVMAIEELRVATGCSIQWAKIWVTHRGSPRPSEEDTAPCPYCGKPLRTSMARQCRFRRRDWHDPNNPGWLGGK
jgi:hypothetical protein